MDDKQIVTLRMQDTTNKNVFSHAFVEAFLSNFDEIEKAEPRVLIIQGLSDVFSGGADRESLMELAAGKLVVRDLVLSERLIHARFPIISAMEGHAMGGGLVIGLCSDIVLMALESRYGAVFINMGFTPGMGTTTLLPLLVGPYVAAEMMMTGRRYRGKELKGLGVRANDIVPKAEVLPKARDLALQIAEKNPKSIALLKASLSTPKKKLLIDARAQEDLMHHLSFAFPETKAIISEFYAGK
jgi:polyketide biosynthesis enoyl-CoA hydratase PksI